MKMSRREVLKAGVKSTVAGITLTEIPTVRGHDITAHFLTRKENGFDPIHMFVHGIYISKWKAILGQAAQVLHTNFRSVRVAKNAYNIPNLIGPPREFVDEDAWKASNLAARGWERKHLLWFQLEVLRMPDSAKEKDDEGPPFPEIHIKTFFEESETWGYAYLKKQPTNEPMVIVKYVKEGQYRRTGNFEVFINLHHLGKPGKGSSPTQWATVIGHEMLHNLGHKHLPGEYVDGRQINAFHRSLACGGAYDGKRLVPGFG